MTFCAEENCGRDTGSIRNKGEIKAIFDSIAGRYDFLNTLLSFGQEEKWRRKLVDFALKGNESAILDLGVGTGRSLNNFLKRKRFELAVGCDFSSGMLQQAKQFLPEGTGLVSCDFHRLPFKDGVFDLVTGSFILRSAQDLNYFFREIYRVLKSGGRAAFLELTKPKNLLFYKLVYQPYLGVVIPAIGRFLTRNGNAYQFLGESIQKFLTGEGIGKVLMKSGFGSMNLRSFNFGAVSMVIAEKE